jgi:hypothetical protein
MSCPSQAGSLVWSTPRSLYPTTNVTWCAWAYSQPTAELFASPCCCTCWNDGPLDNHHMLVGLKNIQTLLKCATPAGDQ